MSRPSKSQQNLAGSLILAHPSMMDPNFRRTVILLSAHNEEGALGVVVNRPMGCQLGDFSEEFADGALADIPVYDGGPVNGKQIMLSAWQSESMMGVFRLYFGIDLDTASGLMASPEDPTIRAFAGYAGWGEGQLEGELAQNAWIVSPVSPEMLDRLEGVNMWRTILGEISPELRFLADAPDDPSRN